MYVYRPLRRGGFMGAVLVAFAGPLIMMGAVLAWFWPGCVPLLLIVLGLFTMVTCALWAGRLHDASQVAPAYGALDYEPRRYYPAPGYEPQARPGAGRRSELDEPPPALGRG